MSKIKYYSLKKIQSKHCQYNMVIGERSNGKTYAALDMILSLYCKTGKQGAYIRRWKDDLIGARTRTMYTAHVQNGLVSKYTGGEWSDIVYYSRAWYLARKNGDKMERSEEPFCYGFALNDMEHDKSTSYPNVTTIVFDEFLSRRGYLTDEFVVFMNVLSTIIRYRDNVVIYMLANTVNKTSPYFREMGLTHIDKMTPGTIDVYQYGTSNLKVAVEYCGEAIHQSKPSDVYFAFNNPRLKMITGSASGAWEIGLYPHKPAKFKDRDIRFMFFIKFDGKILQCEIVRKRDGKRKYDFMFVHLKTTDIKHPDTDLIFDTESNPLWNYSLKINQGMHKAKIVTKILSYFNNEKIFFSDNETGEILRNYIQWCKTSNILQ